MVKEVKSYETLQGKFFKKETEAIGSEAKFLGAEEMHRRIVYTLRNWGDQCAGGNNDGNTEYHKIANMLNNQFAELIKDIG